MSADCWACTQKLGYVSNTQGIKGNPLGACKNCNSFACGHHGYRDGGVPEYICIECIPGWIASSVAADELELPHDEPSKSAFLNILVLFWGGRQSNISNWKLATVQALINSLDLRGVLKNLGSYSINFSAIGDVNFPQVDRLENKRLLVCAALIIRHTYAEKKYPNRFSPYLKFLVDNLYRADNDLNITYEFPVEDPA